MAAWCRPGHGKERLLGLRDLQGRDNGSSRSTFELVGQAEELQSSQQLFCHPGKNGFVSEKLWRLS